MGTRSPFPVPFPCLPLTRSTPSRRSLRPPMCTTPPTPPTTSSPSSPPTPPPSTRPSTFPCTLSRPTLSTAPPSLTSPRCPRGHPRRCSRRCPCFRSCCLRHHWPRRTCGRCLNDPKTTNSTTRLCNPKNFHLPVHVWKLFSVQKAHFPLVCPV